MKLYQDAGVSQDDEASLIATYNRRYGLFTAVVETLGLTAIASPMVIIWSSLQPSARRASSTRRLG